MALDSLYCAWQKANYPYEFYEVMLKHYSDKGKKDKVALLKQQFDAGCTLGA
jgi:DNA polymerase III alpha subunit